MIVVSDTSALSNLALVEIPEVQPVMDALINKAGFRVSTQLYQRVLALAQESEPRRG